MPLHEINIMPDKKKKKEMKDYFYFRNCFNLNETYN